MVEDVVLVFDEGDAEYMKDTFGARECLPAQRVLAETFDQVIANFRINEVLLPPFQVDELLLGGQVEVEEPLDEFSTL